MSSKPSDLVAAIQGRLHRTIDARTHGILDYCYAGAFLMLGFVFLRSNKRAAAAASLFTGSFVLVQALLTDYPLGAKPAISFHTHGQIDGAFASTSWALPYIFGFADTGPAQIFTSASLAEGAIVALTDFSSARARARTAVDQLLS